MKTQCSICGLHPRISTKKGWCVSCDREWHRKHYYANRERILARQRRYSKAHPSKMPTAVSRAWSARRTPEMARAGCAVYYALRTGKLIRPAACEACQTIGRVEAAHYNYTEKLRIRWLCRSCHLSWDSRRSRSVKP